MNAPCGQEDCDCTFAIERRVRPFLKRLIEATKPYHRKEGVSNAAETLFDIYEDAVTLRAVLLERPCKKCGGEGFIVGVLPSEPPCPDCKGVQP